MPWILAFWSLPKFSSFLRNFALGSRAQLKLFFPSLVPRYKEAKYLQMYAVVRLLALQAVNITLNSPANSSLITTQMLAYAAAVVN